jgi:DNA-binding beta-propeller fold protein YncE
MKPSFNHRPLLLLITTCFIVLLGGCASTTKPQSASTKIYSFWPAYPDVPHVQYLTSFARASDLLPPKTGLDELIYGKETLKDLPINKPYGVAMHDGKIYVCDLRNDCVVIMNLRTKQTLMMGTTGSNILMSPNAIAITDDGYKYVSDASLGSIFVFDPQDRFKTIFKPEALKPGAMAIYKDELFVTNFTTNNVLVLDRHDGHELRTIGQPGGEPGQFVKPLGVAVDPSNGDIYVGDVIKCQISRFDHDGKFLSFFGGMSDRVGGFVRPKHIAIDSQGIIYIVDAAFQNVQMFNSKGVVYAYFGSAGPHPGAMDLPAGVCVNENKNDLDLFQKFVHPDFQIQKLILVANQFGPNKVSVYGMGQLKPGKTVKDVTPTKEIVRSGLADPNVAPDMPAPALREGAQAPDETTLVRPTTVEPVKP